MTFFAEADNDGAVAESETLLDRFSIRAWQKKTCSPVLLGGVLWRAVTNIREHQKIRKVLTFPEYADLARSNPRFAFKYLTHWYLARNFTVRDRVSCFVHHYNRLSELLPRPFLQRILLSDVPLFSMENEDGSIAITLGLARTNDKEGELSLNLEVGGEVVYLLSFTIVPGEVMRSQAKDVLLISRIQGVKGCFTQIQYATKRMKDVAPAALLMAVLQGVGAALQIGEMGCIMAKHQNGYSKEAYPELLTSYDDFFTELGVKRNAAGIYLSVIPLEEKPLLQIKRGHKRRTREKRKLKHGIAAMVAQSLADYRSDLDCALSERRLMTVAENNQGCAYTQQAETESSKL